MTSFVFETILVLSTLIGVISLVTETLQPPAFSKKEYISIIQALQSSFHSGCVALITSDSGHFGEQVLSTCAIARSLSEHGTQTWLLNLSGVHEVQNRLRCGKNRPMFVLTNVNRETINVLRTSKVTSNKRNILVHITYYFI